MAPSSVAVARFQARQDNQIMGLELLAISLGLCTFEKFLSGRKVVVHCDNSGSDASFRRGSARSWDHAQLVHEQWLHAVRCKMNLFIKRVATDDNIADLPSREDFVLLNTERAVRIAPVLSDVYSEAETWAVLLERWCV